MESNETNFDVNLLPVISLLAVLISFLLLTAVWLPVGTMDVKQAIGESSDNKGEPDRFAISLLSNNVYSVGVEQKGQTVETVKVNVSEVEATEMEPVIEKLQQNYPDIKMAFIRPKKSTKYENLVAVLAVLKKMELKEIGIEPSL